MRFSKKPYILILILFVGLLSVINSSCASNNDAKKAEIAQRLLADFRFYNGKLQQGQSHYDLIMASDRENGILTAYRAFLSETEVTEIVKGKNDIEDSLDFSTIYNGYSKSGLHFVVLAQPLMDHNFDYLEVMDRIRNYNGEGNFLANIGFLPKSYYALDVFIEDLTGDNKDIKIGISVYSELQKLGKQYPLKNIKDLKLQELLTKSKRDLSDNDTFKSGDWKIYLFEKEVGWPDIVITYQGEEIKLSH